MHRTFPHRLHCITESGIGSRFSFHSKRRPATFTAPRLQGINVSLYLPIAAGRLLREMPGCPS